LGYAITVLAGAAATPAGAQVPAASQGQPWALVALAAAVVIGTVIAVTRRRTTDARLRSELREGEARLDAVVQSAMDAIITVDAEQRIVLFNAAAERMFGVDPRQAIGAPLERFVPERFRAAHRDHVARFGRTGETARRMGRQQALWALRADGSEFPIEASISHAAVAGQQLFTVILRDITDRLATEARVREGEARLDAVVRSAMDAIITVNAAQDVVLFNAAAERMFGIDARQALGAPLARFIPERFRAAHRDHVARFGQTGETARRMGQKQALRALRSDGTEFPIEASISHTTVGGEQLFTVILRDITRRLAADAEIERSHAQLRELAAAMHEVREAERTRVARELHDELGQALTALKMDVDLLQTLSPPGRADLLERIAAMRGLLDSTVQTTRRISADLRPLVLDDLGLSAAAEWLVQQLRQRAQLACELAIDPSLDDLAEPYASVIFRVMQESLTNVAKHARAAHVEVRLARDGDWAVLAVRDDGVGMGPNDEAKPRSFGLRGIRERVLVLGGEVRIVSRPGGGTTLVVRVPLRKGAAREAA
jgi:PAS domain S-box-containing protein